MITRWDKPHNVSIPSKHGKWCHYSDVEPIIKDNTDLTKAIDTVLKDRDHFYAQMEKAEQERDELKQERDELKQERDELKQERELFKENYKQLLEEAISLYQFSPNGYREPAVVYFKEEKYFLSTISKDVTPLADVEKHICPDCRQWYITSPALINLDGTHIVACKNKGHMMPKDTEEV